MRFTSDDVRAVVATHSEAATQLDALIIRARSSSHEMIVPRLREAYERAEAAEAALQAIADELSDREHEEAP